MRLTSRPDAEEAPGTTLQWLTDNELELISALLWITRLGTGTQYSKAAYSLSTKIENLKGDIDFMENAAKNVDLQFELFDAQGFVTSTVGYHGVDIVP